VASQRKRVDPVLNSAKRQKFETDSGIEVDRFYEPVSNPKLGEPGLFPYTRGIYPEMFRQKLWTMRQYAGFGTAKDTNRRFRYLLKSGETGLSVAFDLPTQLGLDSDDQRAQGEVGKVGVAISMDENMRDLFQGIPVGEVSTSMTINATASSMLSMYVVAAEASGVPRSQLRGTTQNDILKEYAARNTYIYPPKQSLDLCIDLIAFCAKEMPKWHPISISGYHLREAGANALQELSFTFADAIEYVKGVIKRGLPIDSFCSQLSFFFAVRNNFMEEVAKFRAARRIWARIVKEEFGSTNPDSMKLKFHAQTSGETLTAQQPLNNVVRVSIQALAAVLGGAQSLHTNSFDEALGLPTEEAVTIALRTQQIIAEETGVTRTVDPVGGSHYVESLTDEFEATVFEELGRIEKIYVQKEIQNSAYEYQKRVDSAENVIVGVNRYESESRSPAKVYSISEKSVASQLRQLRAFRKQRDASTLRKSLSKLEEQASRDALDRKNLVELIIECVRAKATTGEISSSLRAAYGEYRPKTEL
jgi:methylmalonyl-CoA mutase, N-terminal domain